MSFGHRAAGALLLAALWGAAPAAACDLDTAPTTHWSIARENGVAWLRNPCGVRLSSLGVDIVDGGASGANVDRPHYDWGRFAPSRATWDAATRARLLAWGFNSVGAWSLPPAELRLPGAINLELGRFARFHWFDPFDPATTRRMDEEAARLTAPYRGSPYRIGYFSDNEVGWWSGALFLFFSQKPASNHTKQRWVGLMRQLYRGDWRRFATDFVPPPAVASWGALLRAEAPTHLAPGGDGVRAVRAWTATVAGHYYELRRGGDPQGRSRRALLRRPPAHLLRSRRDPRRGAACRCDFRQLQCRQSRRLDRALFFRRPAASFRREAGAGVGMVLCRAREPQRQHE